MGSRYEMFSERARRVLSFAQEEAQQFNHNDISTEHILLALTRDPEGVAARVLSGLGVDLDGIRPQVEGIIGRGANPPQGEISLARPAKKVVELAVDESRRTHQDRIGTQHFLIGLLREREGVGARVLESLGVNLEAVRAAVIRVAGAGDASESPGTRRGTSARLVPLAAEVGEISRRITGIEGQLANLENFLDRRFDELEVRMARLEQLLRDR